LDARRVRYAVLKDSEDVAICFADIKVASKVEDFFAFHDVAPMCARVVATDDMYRAERPMLQ
jgi:hypothetical protein